MSIGSVLSNSFVFLAFSIMCGLLFNASHANSDILDKHVPAEPVENWWISTSRNFAAYEYIPSVGKFGLQAPNRAHNLRTYFLPDGIRVHERANPESPILLQMSLARFGRTNLLSEIVPGMVNHFNDRVEIRRKELIEWYKNSSQGLEQGFTIAERPDGEGLLVLELKLEYATASLSGQSVELHSDHGRHLLYDKLKTVDADGKVLFSRLAIPSPHRLQLIVSDLGAKYPIVIDPILTAVPDKILESDDVWSGGFDSAMFGATVSEAGDVNGDGFADIIVGAHGWDNGLFDEGAAFVFLGSASGIVGNNPSSANAVLLGDQGAAEFGWSVSGAGDVNGDGFDDVVVGAHFYTSTLPGTSLGVRGAAYVFLGSAAGITGSGTTNAHASIFGPVIDSRLGHTVSSAGDVNGDGFGDIILGMPRLGIPFPCSVATPPTCNIPINDSQGAGGSALIFHGSAAGITGSFIEDADHLILPYPSGQPVLTSQQLGADVAAAGDVNNDGFDDVIIGAIDYDVIFHGSVAGILGTHPGNADTRISSDASISIGALVSGAGDVDGDGFDDVLLGATALNPVSRGVVLLYTGSASGIIGTGPADAETTIVGEDASLGLGVRFSDAGDIDGDGFADIIVGGRGYLGGLNQEGVAYIFRGSASGLIVSSAPNAYVRLEPGQSGATLRGNKFGFDVSGAGDINGDGFSDVLMGLGLYDAGQTDEGAVFVYHGGTAPLIANQAPVPMAGADQTVVDIDGNGVAAFSVNGDLSFDPDGTIVAYEWREGETVLGTSPMLSAELSATGDHPIVLTVTDDVGLSRGDLVIVRVEIVQTPRVGFDDFSSGGFAGGVDWSGSWSTTGEVTLSSIDTFPTPPQARLGAGSSLSRSTTLPADTSGVMVKFWAKASQFAPPDQVLVQISRDGGAFTTLKTFTAADSNESYAFYGGTVGDGRITLSWFPETASNVVLRFQSNTTSGLFFVDDVELRALVVPVGTSPPPTGEFPVANAGGDITVDDNDSDGFELVILDGTQSSDADGFLVSYEWFEIASNGQTFLLGTGATLGVSFARGNHSVRLVVTDNDGGSAGSGLITVTVNQALGNNQPPVAIADVAGGETTITDFDGNGEEFVLLEGRASTDADGSIASYVWRENGIVLSNVPGTGIIQDGQLRIILPVGVHSIELTVTDNQGSTSTDTVVITVATVAPAPPIDSFTAMPLTITVGQSSNLCWTTTGADTVMINAGSNLPLDGCMSVSPTSTQLYILTAIGPAGVSDYDLIVTVNPAPPGSPTIDNFTVTPASITVGGSAALSWATTDADSVSINSGVGIVAVDGGTTVNPTVTTNYILTATGAGGTAIGSILVTVNSAPPSLPTIDTFVASPTSITSGSSANLSWTTTGADTVSIDNGVGAVAIDGNVTVTPGSTTSYILTATGPGGPVTSSQTITVQTASAETLSITNFEYRANKNEWRIAGISSISGPGNNMTLYVGPTVTGSPVLGSANVDNLGDWEFRQRDSSVSPHSSGMISVTSSQGGVWEGISGTGPAPGSNPPPPTPTPPTVDTYAAQPAAITEGDTSTISWMTTNATSVSINGVGTGLAADGSVVVTPAVTTSYALTATGPDGQASGSVTITVSPAPTPTPPSPVQGIVTISAPTSFNRGGEATFSATLTNTGEMTITNVTMTISISPNRRIRKRSPGNTVTIADVPSGNSASQTWQGEADKAGSATLTAEVFSGATLIDTSTHTFSVVK